METFDATELIRRTRNHYTFPDPARAPRRKPLAWGGDLSPGRLISAYAQGIFPWFSEDEPILWWSPDPRFVLFPEETRISSSLLRESRHHRWEIRIDSAFAEVVRACASVPRPGQEGTWITDDMMAAYTQLHEEGFAHSFEAWTDGQLAGGLYGISLGRAFFGESMFFHQPNASKVAFVHFLHWIRHHRFTVTDCQVHTDHLARFGAEEVPRRRFLRMLATALDGPTLRGRWEPLDRFSGSPAADI